MSSLTASVTIENHRITLLGWVFPNQLSQIVDHALLVKNLSSFLVKMVSSM